VLRSVHDLVVVTDVAGIITYFNPMAEQATEGPRPRRWGAT
jgi:PAS domain-containing protein